MQRVGRDEEAAEANRNSVAADLAYFAMTNPLDYYVMYTAHNYQFLAFSAAMEGRKAEMIEAARQSRALVSDDMLLRMPGTDWYVAELYAAMVRFGMWDNILAEPAPNPKLIGLSGAYLYAKATALAANRRVEDAKASLSELEKLAASIAADADDRTQDVLTPYWRAKPASPLQKTTMTKLSGCCAMRSRRRTGSPTQNPPTGSFRTGIRWARCWSTPAWRQRLKQFTGMI